MNGEANDKRRCVVKATLYQIKKKKQLVKTSKLIVVKCHDEKGNCQWNKNKCLNYRCSRTNVILKAGGRKSSNGTRQTHSGI